MEDETMIHDSELDEVTSEDLGGDMGEENEEIGDDDGDEGEDEEM
ncbi:MAG: hypothetical protein ACE5F2_00295 [Candidatus Paceibacteria bacterium]